MAAGEVDQVLERQRADAGGRGGAQRDRRDQQDRRRVVPARTESARAAGTEHFCGLPQRRVGPLRRGPAQRPSRADAGAAQRLLAS